MKIYEVGGAVRDDLLGLPVKDRDYVVVGSTPEEMLGLGYRPVGKDFPVFLHPQTQEEYALARTERKTAPGYKGFQFHTAPDVTLEQDLERRDLSINAIARDEAGKLIDPYSGEADLRAGLLRHVSPAFIEDPVRILRVARFAARFAFSVAPETLALMRRMVAEGEVDALVPERVWQEFSRGLMEKQPLRMFEVLRGCGALSRIFPQWAALNEARALSALSKAAQADADPPCRYATLFVGATPELTEQAAAHLRAPADCRDLAILISRLGNRIVEANALVAEDLLDLLQQADALRRPDRFAALLNIAIFDGAPLEQGKFLSAALEALQAVDAGAVAHAYPQDVAAALREARIAVLETFIQNKT